MASPRGCADLSSVGPPDSQGDRLLPRVKDYYMPHSFELHLLLRSQDYLASDISKDPITISP